MAHVIPISLSLQPFHQLPQYLYGVHSPDLVPVVHIWMAGVPHLLQILQLLQTTHHCTTFLFTYIHVPLNSLPTGPKSADHPHPDVPGVQQGSR